MTSLSSDFTGCSILIYDEAGNDLGSTTIVSYNRAALRIEVKDTPLSLNMGSICRLLILSSPSPCEYQGRIVKEGSKKNIALFFGQEKENRRAARFKVNYPALIENLICDGKAYPLLSPLEAILINISQSGVRFRTPINAFSNGDRFQMRLLIGHTAKLLIADVIDHVDKDNSVSEYGCQFLIGSERVV